MSALTRLKLRHVHTFIAVCEHQSVVKAATRLNVSQPAVTKTIRELEEILGVSLFNREGRGTKTNAAGDIFLRHALATRNALSKGVELMSQEAAYAGPPIRIGALPTVSARIMPAAVTQYLSGAKDRKLKVITGENAVLLDQLRTGDLDIVVGRLAAPERMTGLSFEHLYSEKVRFVVRSGHPLIEAGASIFDRLSLYPVLVPTKNSVIGPVVEQFLLARGVMNIPHAVETVSDSFGRAFVRSSDAVWIISEGVVTADIADGSLSILPVETGDTSGPVGLTVRADSETSVALFSLKKAIRQAVETLRL